MRWFPMVVLGLVSACSAAPDRIAPQSQLPRTTCDAGSSAIPLGIKKIRIIGDVTVSDIPSGRIEVDRNRAIGDPIFSQIADRLRAKGFQVALSKTACVGCFVAGSTVPAPFYIDPALRSKAAALVRVFHRLEAGALCGGVAVSPRISIFRGAARDDAILFVSVGWQKQALGAVEYGTDFAAFFKSAATLKLPPSVGMIPGRRWAPFLRASLVDARSGLLLWAGEDPMPGAEPLEKRIDRLVDRIPPRAAR